MKNGGRDKLMNHYKLAARCAIMLTFGRLLQYYGSAESASRLQMRITGDRELKWQCTTALIAILSSYVFILTQRECVIGSGIAGLRMTMFAW